MRGFADLLADLLRIPVHEHKRRPEDPHWCNGWFPGMDAVSIYGFLAERNPAHYYEVGSGNSTKFARRAIRDHDLRTEIISIDPYPRAEIDAICDRVLRCTLEDVEPQHFNGTLDTLFLDFIGEVLSVHLHSLSTQR